MKKTIIFLAALFPAVASAQVITDVNSLNYKLTNIGNAVVELLIAFAVIYIIYKVIRFIMADGEARAEARSSILWGILGLAVILSIWGLVAILTNTFRTNNQAPVQSFPQIGYPQPVP